MPPLQTIESPSLQTRRSAGDLSMIHSRDLLVMRPRPEPDAKPRHDARRLTGGGVEAEILLDGMRYVLRITRQGKLILTK